MKTAEDIFYEIRLDKDNFTIGNPSFENIKPEAIIKAMKIYALSQVKEQRRIMSNHLNMRNVPYPDETPRN